MHMIMGMDKMKLMREARPAVLRAADLLAQSEAAAVYIGRCAAYPTGLDFELHVLAAASAGDLDPSLNGIHQRPGGGRNPYKSWQLGNFGPVCLQCCQCWWPL